MSRKEVQKLLDNPPPSWQGLFKKYGLPKHPTSDQVIGTILEYTPTGRKYGEKGSSKYKPPASVRKAAMKGLKLSHEFNYTSSSGIGLARAIQLAVCPVIWERSVIRMRNYFTRHKIDKLGRNFGNDKDPSNGYMAWLNWGGDPGEKWVSNLKSNPAPGYQSWQWTKQDWRSVIVKGSKIDYSKKCGAKGTQLPDKSPRLCLPLYVLDTLSKTAKGRKIIREQARKKEKAKRGQRVPWHPEIKRLHNKLEKMIPEDDPKLRKNPPWIFIDELMGRGFEDYPWEEYPALIYRWENGCAVIVNLQGSGKEAYLGTIKVSGPDRCFRKRYGTQAMEMIVEAADLHGVKLKLIALPFGAMKMPPAKLKEWYKGFGFKMRRGSDEAMERSPRKNPKRRKNPLRLDSVAMVKTDFPGADFWIQRKGSRKTVGKVKRNYAKEAIGIKIRSAYLDRIDPRYLSYVFEYLYQQGVWEPLAVGTLNLKHIRVSEVKSIPLEIPSVNPKRRKNPKFKIGDRVSEGNRKGTVHALHSKGTVDVMFEDMDYPVRRQYHQVMRANPAIKVEDYDPALAQYHAQVQGIYESLVRKSLGARSSVPFKNARGKRMDASFSREKVRDLLNNAFNIAVGVGRKEGTLAKAGLKPTALGRKKSRARLDDYPKWWENLIDYETTLSKARMVPYRVLVVQEKGRKKYYAMPLGAKYSTKRDAVAEAEQLNEQVRKRVERRTRTKRRQPRPDRYFVKASKSSSGPFRRIGVFTRKREAIQEAKKVVNDGRYKASLVEARYRHGRALLVDLDTGEITDQRLG